LNAYPNLLFVVPTSFLALAAGAPLVHDRGSYCRLSRKVEEKGTIMIWPYYQSVFEI